MRFYSVSLLGAALQTVTAQLSTFSPSAANGVAYAVSVPSSGSDIYFQIKAPTSYQWVALGQGTGMSGSNIFIMYAASSTNVTVSPRLGKGEFEPSVNSAAKITVLSGTGISNGVMTANVKCSSCATWDGGSMDFKSSSTNWIWAARPGDALNSQALDADLRQHSNRGRLNFDLVRAAGGQEPNPFQTSTSSASASGSSGAPAATASSSSGGGSSGGGSSGGSSQGPSVDPEKLEMIINAHGSIMGLAFVLFFPLGAFILHLLPRGTAHVAWIHGFNQLVGLLLAIAGMGLGIYFAKQTEKLNKAHPIIGLVVVSFLFFQALGGVVAHSAYKKAGKRSVAGMGHSWFGRALIVLGIINGGLGLQLAMAETKYKIVYGIFAGLVGLAYLGFIGYIEANRGKRSAAGTVEKSNGHGTVAA